MRNPNSKRSLGGTLRSAASLMLATSMVATTVFSGTALADVSGDVAAEVTMSSTSIGGVTYYYADTEGQTDATYKFSVTTGRGPSAVTTDYTYDLSQLTEVGDTSYYYIVSPGATALSGTLYGYGEGTTKTYKDIYGAMDNVTCEDEAYDAVTSATAFSSFHAKDISSVVAYGTDADGNKALVGATLERASKSVDANAYVEASVLKAAGVDLTEDQTNTLDITLKKNPTSAASEDDIATKLSSATWETSRYGTGEFVIVPDDTVEGYVWSEYWDNVYAATISDGTTTVGAVHWIDLYGEDATSGGHYNKLEIALNNGTSVGANAAEVSRYAAFYDTNTGNVKPGTYTITVYAEGYTALTAEVTIPSEELQSTSIGGISYYYADTTDDAANTVYTATVRGRGGNTVYNFVKSGMTQVGDTNYYYVTTPGTTPLEGTLYAINEGTASTYKDVYEALGVSADDTYDAVSSATNYTSFHAKDISSVVTYGTDADGNKVINGLNLKRTYTTVEAADYVNACVLKAAGVELSEEQTAAAALTLKKNPTKAASEDDIDTKISSATWTTSRYGTGEFVIVPDDTVEGYVWSEYWDNVYAATISDGTTTVGAVHWIDLYGEDATSGGHYNKLEIALNNGTSVGSNAAEVSRYAAFYDTNTGNVKAGTYTITVYAEGYTALTAEVTVTAEAMTSTSIGGVTYYYADTTDKDAATVYTVSVTQGRGPSATTTVYNYTKENLTQVGDSNIYYMVAPGATALSGTLYGYGEGTTKSYKDVYGDMGITCEDPAYDAVTSATAFTSFHAKDISSVATYGTDEEGNKTLTGVSLNRTAKTVEADTYVTASLLKAAGATLTEEQTEALNITLKKNPTSAASEDDITPVLKSATWTTSRYGTGEFVIVPDDTVEGYVWSEYWDNVYAATISDGTTTVGAVHWIDLYGEDATSGGHYNKLEIALNNGTSVGSNAAEVSRYAAFYNEDNTVKIGTYTITVYADGYAPLVATVAVKNVPTITLEAKTAVYTGKAIAANTAVVTGSEGAVTYKYYKDAECTTEVEAAEVVNAGTYYVKATVAETDTTYEATSAAAELTITKATPAITLKAKSTVYTGKAIAANTAVVTGSEGAVTYKYYTDAECTKEVAAAKVVNAGTYYVKATVAETDNTFEATSEAAKLTITKVTPAITLKAKSVTYTGKAIAIAAATVKNSTGKVTYKYYSDSKCTKSVAASKVVNAGTYYVKATVAATTNANSATSSVVKLVIKKAAQSVKVTASNKTVKYTKVKKAAQTVKSITKVTGVKTSVSYKKVSGSAKLTVNTKTGKVTVKKGTKKGTYSVKIKVLAKSSTNYNAKTVNKTVKVVVK